MSSANLFGMAKGFLKSGGMNIIGSMIGSRARKRELREAELGYDKQLAALESQDISNPYMNQENVYEDLTVNTQEADMLAAQQQQSLANTMGNLQGAAGGSGIAALAQSMANQQSQNLQRATASIGAQEQANQMKQMAQQDVLNQRFIQGEMYNRKAQASRNAGMLGRAEQRFTDAIAAKQAATDQLMSGIGQVTGFGSETLPGGSLHRVGQSGGVQY
tara:strand:+ start:16085 stop:16738 length:654 start_codon:yes stop_codon:yes gene_type:complete